MFVQVEGFVIVGEVGCGRDDMGDLLQVADMTTRGIKRLDSAAMFDNSVLDLDSLLA